jgi:two-component system cell cycle sensor histidine kinase/response regulator CckA
MTHSLLNRPDRLAALRHTALLDTPPEEGFDRLTRMASRLLGTPVSLISLVTDERQFFKSSIGLPDPWASRQGAPISFSLCPQVVSAGEQLIVEDARRHPLLRHSAAIRELGWVAYAGVPLITRDGHTVGSFSVVDTSPRLWSERDIALLKDLAASAVTEIELRRESAQRRQAEQGRRDSQEQFHSTFEQSGIGMGLISPDGRWLRVNPALSDMLGIASEDLVGSPAEASTHPDDLTADREATRLLLAGECRTYTMEKRYLTARGEVVWALVNVSLVPGTDGDPPHLIAGIQDITDRKEAEAALRASEERFRLVAQASNEVVWDWDLLTDRITWDEGTGPLLDYGRSEPGGVAEWWYERLHPEDRERVVGSMDSAIGQGESTWSEEYRFRRADGGYAVVQDRAHIVHDESGMPIRVISAMADLTRGRRAERRLHQVLDALPSGVWIVDRHGRIVLDNAASRQIWGPVRHAAIDQLGGYHGRWAATGEPLQPEEWGAARALKRGETSHQEELTIETPEGGQKTIVNSAMPIKDADGQTVGAVNVSEDVTERRAQAAAAVRQNERAQETAKMDAISRLAGGIAHDFNNLLTGILTYSELILQELRSSDPLRADIEQIRHAGQRGAALTRQLLAFSRRQLLQPGVTSLNTLVLQMESTLSRLLGPEVTLETELDPLLTNVLVDSSQMEQVLVNLALNAREAMPSGGRLVISTANAQLDRDGAHPAGTYASIAVRDTGVGMDEATSAHIFEPFFTTKQGASGAGLGLSTVYGIVEQSGGHICVQSAPGSGTSFSIYLPGYTGAEPATAAGAAAIQGGTETLLLVEDEITVRSSVRRLLQWHGYRVLEARNGAEALRVYENNTPGIDLVLTDLVMPEMGGQELVEQLRVHNPDLKVVFMSGYAEKTLTSNGALPPGTGFVDKPFTVEILMRRVREVLDHD